MFILKEKEKKLLGILSKYVTVKDASQEIQAKLGLSLRATYNILYRIRRKQVEARRYVNVMLNYRRQSSILDKLLTPKVRLKEERMELEEEAV